MSAAQLASISVGLVFGGLFGIHVAQKYELPDLHNFLKDLFSKARDYENTTRKSGTKKE